jgi:hypothetical protein
MAILANFLVAADQTTIMYGGDTYYRLADDAEFLAGDLAYVRRSRADFLTPGGVYEILGPQGKGRYWYVDDNGSRLNGGRDSTVAERIFFRKRSASTSDILAAKRAESEALAAEITALEAKMRAEIVGSIAFVSDEGYHDDIPAGTLVKITEIDDDYEEYPYKAELLDGSDYDRFDRDSLEPVTYETARARLIAEVDRQLAAAFPDAKVAA